MSSETINWSVDMTTDQSHDIPVGELPGGTTVIAASLSSGRKLLSQTDTFVDNQSRFDRQARLNLRHCVVDVTTEIYLDYVESQVMAWEEPDEIESLRRIVGTDKQKETFESIHTKFKRLAEVNLPDKIWLVKTTGLEEGYAAYTRGMNVIALPANMVESLQASPNFGDPLHPSNDLTYLQDVITHECFHLFSKNNPVRREELYALVNYKSTGHPVRLPDVKWPENDSPTSMRDLKITNPDTPTFAVYIEMDVPENATEPDAKKHLVKRPLLPILIAQGSYDGGIFFSVMEKYFMVIEQDSAGNWKPAIGPDERPILYPMKRGTPLFKQYLDLIGHNLTGELFHPDEILAQNFVFVANLPDTQLLARMGTVLGRNTAPA